MCERGIIYYIISDGSKAFSVNVGIGTAARCKYHTFNQKCDFSLYPDFFLDVGVKTYHYLKNKIDSFLAWRTSGHYWGSGGAVAWGHILSLINVHKFPILS